MSLRTRILWLGFLLCSVGFRTQDSVSISQPYSAVNLTIYLIEGNDQVENPYLSLDDALKSKKAVIHENNSQKLWIENLSGQDLFVQSGELIKGGQQDRLIANDLIIAANDSASELQVYCIEAHRNTKRGDEPLETFSGSSELAPWPHMRVVANHDVTSLLLSPHVGGLTQPDEEQLHLLESVKSISQLSQVEDAVQQSIWKDVSGIQDRLTAVIGDSVTKNSSPSSLQLALEHASLRKSDAAYEKELLSLINLHPKALGVLYSINGVLQGGEQYCNHDLLLHMWPKLLRAYSTEAVVRSREATSPSSNELVQQYLSLATTKSASRRENSRTEIRIADRTRDMVLATLDTKFGSQAVHRSYLLK